MHLYSTVYYWYHRCLSLFALTIGLVTMIASANPETVNTSWALLKFSLSTSNVLDGATLVENRSRPYANTSDVDSSSAGAVRICRTFKTWFVGP